MTKQIMSLCRQIYDKKEYADKHVNLRKTLRLTIIVH